MKNNNKLYAILVAAMAVMLIAGLVLGWIFFDQLLKDAAAKPGDITDTSPDIQLPQLPEPQKPNKNSTVNTANTTSSQRNPMKGAASGRDRKFQPKIPSQPSPKGIEPPQPEKPENQDKEEALKAFHSMPLTFKEECNNKTGCHDFDFHAPGAGFDIVMNPQTICLKMRRQDVNIPAGTNMFYEMPDGSKLKPCELEREVKVCFNMLGAQPNTAPGLPEDIYATDNNKKTNSTYSADTFKRWHDTLPGGDKEQTKKTHAYDDNNDNEINRSVDFTTHDPLALLPAPVSSRSVEYKNIYPGIDLTCYGDMGHFEFVYVIRPGADPENIRLAINGINNKNIDENGNLILNLTGGRIIQHAPRAYQIIDGIPTPIDVDYLLNNDEVKFKVPEYNHKKTLFISPKLDYASYLGGTGFERSYSIAVDNNGFAYVAGATSSPIFGDNDPDMPKQRNNVDIFVTKFRIADSQPIYTSFIGGDSTDRAFSIAADDKGNAYICGETLSSDFPTTNTTVNAPANKSWNGFLTILGPKGTNMLFSSTFGGSDDDRFYSIALDTDTNIYMAGETSSGDIPIKSGFQRHHRGGSWDGFIVRVNHSTMQTDFSTYLGGSKDDTINAITVDYNKNLIIAGETSSKDLGTVNALQPGFNGGKWDGFVARLPDAGKGIGFLSYIGGNNDDRINGVSADSAGNIYLAGETSSGNFAVSSNAVQKLFGGGDWDAFIMKLLPDGSEIVYSSYFGGNGDDRGFSIDADPTGNAFLAGETSSDNLPAISPILSNYAGGDNDGFIARFSPAGSKLTFSTYYGGSKNDALYAITVDGARSAHFSGLTSSTNLPILNASQNTYGGGQSDAIYGRILQEDNNTPELKIIPGGGQPNGPKYDFYASKAEITNEKWVRFLNDAQANTNNARGANMYFDSLGNVWINPAMDEDSQEMFIAYRSRIKYNPKAAIGERYYVTPKIPDIGGSYSNHPVINVSWYGAVKYCNWLTIDSGRGTAERCFFEGTNSWDWRPVTCAVTNWLRGTFTDRERQEWLKYKGYRLPMDNSEEPPELSAGDFAVANEQFVQFLNDAESHTNTIRGANMYFDSLGNVWFNPDKPENRDMLFSIYDSKIMYNPTKPAGTRYSVSDIITRDKTIPISKFPVKGVTEYGKAKFCNWLTLHEGGTVDDLCYTEGSNKLDWAPTPPPTAAEWKQGIFTRDEQEEWLKLKGRKLPLNIITNADDWIYAALMDYEATNSWPNPYNEFYKISAWNGETNLAYAFGRDKYSSVDANFLDSGGHPIYDTTPVSFYNGKEYTNILFRTLSEENHYGLYDVSGNTSEWLTDPGKMTSLKARACYGGAWIFGPIPNSQRYYVPPYFCNGFRGFRVVTTHSSEDMFIIRIPYKICLCGKGIGPGCGEKEAIEDELEDEGKDNTLDINPKPTEPGGVVPKPVPPKPHPAPPHPKPKPPPPIVSASDL